ncbi:MAG: hypothetical protein P4L56_26745 [Candidatus Sulfopaludibacter sp.]|nr:hypothetical protein [Candidatus Sulfopaludibacter sp.]
MSIRVIVVGLLAVAIGLSAQDPPPAGRGRFGGGPNARFLGAEAGPPGRVVRNAPYSAEMITESTQTLADGNHIRQSATARVFRDSEGRTRTEQSLKGLGALAGNTNLPNVIFISDPVAGSTYALNPSAKTATKGGWMRPGRSGPPPANRAEQKGRRRSGDNANVKTESLGRQTIDGVAADGTRTTTTIPAGELGNEQPIQIVTERWYSPDLQTFVLSKRTDPRSGETITRLSGIARGEPAHSLFEVPADYKVSQ